MCQFPVGLCFIGDLVHCTDFSDHSRGGITAREERPPGSAGVPALRLVKKDPTRERGRPARTKTHPGARASRHDGREPRKGGFGAPCKGVALDGRLFAGIRCGRDARAPGWMTNQGRRSMQAIRWSLRPSAPRLAMLGLRQSRGLCLVPVSRGSMLHWRLGALHRFLGPFSRWRHYGS